MVKGFGCKRRVASKADLTGFGGKFPAFEKDNFQKLTVLANRPVPW